MDTVHLSGFDHLELWVGNARQAAGWYAAHMGFRVAGYSGPEVGQRDRASWLVVQNGVQIVLTTGLSADHPITEFVGRHGDAVRDVAFEVPDCEAAFVAAVERGAHAVSEPVLHEDDNGKLVTASIAAYGDTVHTFVERSAYSGLFAPGFVRWDGPGPVAPVGGLMAIDHVVANVELGAMDCWVDFYRSVLGFDLLVHYDDDTIHTEFSALMSKVVWDGSHAVKLPINEPAGGRRKSQIQEYLDFHGGPGVQHVAIRTDDILGSVDALGGAGLGFLQTPPGYYEELGARVGDVGVDISELASRGILADSDPDGFLLQIFTNPVQDRPTLFYELIERHGSLGFGVGNFQALFEAIEREQAKRGNL